MFKFSLQRVLDLRTQREHEAARSLNEAYTEVERARQDAEALVQVRDQSLQQRAAVQSGSTPAGELRNYDLLLQQVDQQIAAANEQVREAEARLELQQDDLDDASRNRRVMDRLRDKYQQSWRLSEAKKDQQTMDAIALSRYVRLPSSS